MVMDKPGTCSRNTSSCANVSIKRIASLTWMLARMGCSPVYNCLTPGAVLRKCTQYFTHDHCCCRTSVLFRPMGRTYAGGEFRRLTKARLVPQHCVLHTAE